MKAALVGALIGLVALPGAALEVNQASQAELESVTGIGVDLATRIVAVRQTRPFEDWADLMARVRGIGTARAARLSEVGLTVGERGYTAGPSSGPAKPASAQVPLDIEAGTDRI